MEQCGESLKNRGFLREDRITELPEALLLKILSLLPTKIVITTSVLSKQWRSLCKVVPKLEFDQSYEDNIHKFAENVGRFLLSHKAPRLESLHLKIQDTCDGVYIGIWTGIAFSRHLRELVLDLPNGQHPVRLPSSLFCFDTLETLKLKDGVLLDVPSPVSMKSLRTLHLESVVYKDDESVCNIFSSCPNLENLVLQRVNSYYNNNAVEKFFIEAPSLKTLSLYDNTNGRENGGYVINAPCLKYLKIESLKRYAFFLIENASELVEANISDVSYIVNEEILRSLKSAKLLSLDLSPFQITYPSGVIFSRLVYLEIYTHKAEWWNLLTLVLDSSPRLQVLNLIDHLMDCYKEFMDDASGKWKQPKSVPECLLSHLEIFVWTRYDWEREEEKQVATYILRNAKRLKKATFSAKPIEPQKKLEMINEFNGVVRASSSCHLVFECT